MTDTPTPTPTPPAPEPARFVLLDVGGLLAALDVATSALDGDGSLSTMPDVAPHQAARWIFAALDDAGYVLVRRVEP